MRIALFLLLLPLLGACTGPATGPPPDPELMVLEDEGASFMARQEVTGVFGGEEHRFEAVFQKQGLELTVIGLTPFGTKAFVLVQEGLNLRFEDNMPKDRKLRLKPRFLLADVHHAFLVSGTPGEWTPALGGEEVLEEVQAGRLVSRTFRKVGEEEPIVRVTYEGTIGDAGFPRTAHVKSLLYGYTLDIETVSYQALE